jgi:hypothetical protein
VKAIEIYPRENGQGWGGVCKRLTRRGVRNVGAEVLIRLSGPAIESVIFGARWDFGDGADFDQTLTLLGDVAAVHGHWQHALRFVERERARIERLAGALARPPYQLSELAIMALVAQEFEKHG